MDGGMFRLRQFVKDFMKLADHGMLWVIGGILLFVTFLMLMALTLDPTFIVRGDEINLIDNPNFDDPERGFAGWNVGGCATYVRPPKEGAAKAGPLSFDGGCLAGETAVISQTFTVPTETAVIAFTYREILKGAGNHITVTLGDGNGWEWVARDTGAQNGCFCFTPVVTSTIPMSTTELFLRIDFLYTAGIGNKVTAVTVTSD